MIYIGDNKTTGEIDSYSINTLNIPGIVLMENAARNFTGTLDTGLDNFLIVCGKGNNGGDGYAIARQLVSLDKQVSVFSCETSNMSRDCRINYDICRNLGIPMESDLSALEKLISSHDVVIDAVFGTGLDKALGTPYDKIINNINQYGKYIISVDIPSGINGSTGETAGISVKADKTVSFVTYKQGFLNYSAAESLGKVKVVNIGLPEYVIKKFSNTVLMDKKYINSLLIPRLKYSHKGNFGHTLIIAGSPGFTGAAVISANAAVKTGSGLVTLAVFHECLNMLSSCSP
ncbi:MAG: NAD(P)H-hydrate epimerase, partial [Fusobacteriales bacterium]|nr:NAD(P)H-hydrate epimerase [Fusobacteriales bacterium]